MESAWQGAGLRCADGTQRAAPGLLRAQNLGEISDREWKSGEHDRVCDLKQVKRKRPHTKVVRLHQATIKIFSATSAPYSASSAVQAFCHDRESAAEILAPSRSARRPPKAWIVLVPATTSPPCCTPRGIKYSSPARTGIFRPSIINV